MKTPATLKADEVVFIRLKTGEQLLANVTAWRVPAKESFAGSMSVRCENVATLRGLANPQNPKQIGYSVIKWMCDTIDIPLSDIGAIGVAASEGASYHTEVFRRVKVATPEQAQAISKGPVAANH